MSRKILPPRRRLSVLLFRVVAAGAVVGAVVTAGGCVRRTIRISSEPEGALVWLNDREVGRTPLDVEFLYYGTYDVRLVRDGYEPLLTSGRAKAPWWDVIGIDLVSEMVPGERTSLVEWHYDLEPIEGDVDLLRLGLIERGRAMRGELPAAEAGPGAASDAAPDAPDSPES